MRFQFAGGTYARRWMILCAFWCCGLVCCRKNPMESSPASVAEGERLYRATDCGLCHGKDGDGNGVLAKDINMNLHDWSEPESLARFTDGELSHFNFERKNSHARLRWQGIARTDMANRQLPSLDSREWDHS